MQVDETPEPVEPAEIEEYVPPTGDEPWARYLENVPDVLQPEIVGAFREQSAAADQRIGNLTRYQSLADSDVDPEAAQAAIEFATVLYGQVDPNDPVAVSTSKTQRLNFFNTYKGVLEEAGILSKAEIQEEEKRQQEAVAAEREFETTEQTQLRELKERYEALEAQTTHLTQAQQQAQQSEQDSAKYTELTTAYASDWKSAIEKHGQVSKREFEMINMIAKADENDAPGVISRAYERMIRDFGRQEDLVAPTTATPRPPVTGPGGGQQVPVPGGDDLRFDSPEGRGNRRKVALEELARLAAQ